MNDIYQSFVIEKINYLRLCKMFLFLLNILLTLLFTYFCKKNIFFEFQRRRALLEDSIRLFGFYRECDDFEKWIKDKERMLRTDDPTENVEAAKRKYEVELYYICLVSCYETINELPTESNLKLNCILQKFLTDLSASSKRVEAIDAAVGDFVHQGHSQIDKVKARQRHIHQLWDNLNRLKAQKERNLEGASR